MGMRRLLGELVRGEDLAVEVAADRTHPLVFHRDPFELLYPDALMELEPSLVVRTQDLGAGDHLHAVLRLAEHARPGLPEGILVHNDVTEVSDDVVGALPRGDAAHDGAFDAVRQFAVDIPGENEVVVHHEIEGVGVHQGEDARRELVYPVRREVAVEGHLRCGEFADAVVHALPERRFGVLAESEGVVLLDGGQDVREFAVESVQTLECSKFVVRERA